MNFNLLNEEVKRACRHSRFSALNVVKRELRRQWWQKSSPTGSFEHICAIYAKVLCNWDRPNPISHFRIQVLMSYLRACRTFTTTSLNASTPSSKVPPKSNTQTYHIYMQHINVLNGNSTHLCKGSSDAVENIMDEVEKYMMTRLYKEVFCPETTDDEKKDLAIQKRIRSDTKAITRGTTCNWQMSRDGKSTQKHNWSGSRILISTEVKVKSTGSEMYSEVLFLNKKYFYYSITWCEWTVVPPDELHIAHCCNNIIFHLNSNQFCSLKQVMRISDIVTSQKKKKRKRLASTLLGKCKK